MSSGARSAQAKIFREDERVTRHSEKDLPAAPITTDSVRVPDNPTNGESYATFSILLA